MADQHAAINAANHAQRAELEPTRAQTSKHTETQHKRKYRAAIVAKRTADAEALLPGPLPIAHKPEPHAAINDIDTKQVVP